MGRGSVRWLTPVRGETRESHEPHAGGGSSPLPSALSLMKLIQGALSECGSVLRAISEEVVVFIGLGSLRGLTGPAVVWPEGRNRSRLCAPRI